ncbi:MAG: hypothetical protein PHV62_08355 [Sulfuricurvum sp.]|nr:hypothetical protein [Sulfuricurvum sp.]
MDRISTRTSVEISIDEDTFHVVISDLDSSQKVEMNKRAEELEAVTADIRKVSSLMDDIETNKQLIACVGVVEKAKLLWENKEIKRNITELQKKVSDANLDKMYSDSLMRRLELTLSGEDKPNLMAAIKSKSIDPQVIIEKIGKQIEEEKKKKLTV